MSKTQQRPKTKSRSWPLCATSRKVIKEARSRADKEGKDPKLAEHAAMILRLGKRAEERRRSALEDVIQIGWRYTEAKRLVGHGRFGGWCESETGCSQDTAQNFMRVYELAEDPKFRNFRNLDIPVSALYLLAKKSTPDATRAEVIKRAEAGEKITVKTAKELSKTDQPKVVKGLQAAAKDKASEAAERNNRRVARRIIEINHELISLAKFARPGAIIDPEARAEWQALFQPQLLKLEEGRKIYSRIIDDLCRGGQEPPTQTAAA